MLQYKIFNNIINHSYYSKNMEVNTKSRKKKIEQINNFRSKSISPKLQSPLFTNNILYTNNIKKYDLSKNKILKPLKKNISMVFTNSCEHLCKVKRSNSLSILNNLSFY